MRLGLLTTGLALALLTGQASATQVMPVADPASTPTSTSAVTVPAAPLAGPSNAVGSSAPARSSTSGAGAGQDATSADPVGPATASSMEANARMASILATRGRSKVLGSRFTLTVWDPAQSKWVFKRRADTPVLGASTTKVLTAVAALETMGPTTKFPTTVRGGSGPDEVILVAGGDPLLSSADLRRLARATAGALTSVSQSGQKPTLSVRADDSLFVSSGRPEGWQQGWLPSEVRPVGAFARDDRQVRDATADAGRYFTKALAKLGVPAKYRGETTATAAAPMIAGIEGHTLAESVKRMLLVSDNDTAEMIFRHVAIARGERPDWAGARRAVRATLEQLGIPMNGAKVVDGSGLSVQGRVTAAQLTAALNLALSPEHPRLSGLRSSLPVAGRTGSLKAKYKRFTSKPAKCAVGRIQAKTGTLADAISLAGYAQGSDGQTRVFVAVVNGRPTKYSRNQTRQAVDKVVSSITGCW